MPIKILPARLANQIAAGEVVERPFSVVKELLENSLDAGATKVEVSVEKGGHKRILIRDNGAGINKDELGLALSRHATSKIASLEDLECIESLGFRGEALASISSVSRLLLSSSTANQTEGWQAICEGREMEVSLRPTPHPIGTSVDVQDLFFNTPARRKFLRTEKTEFSHIENLFKRISLSRFDVHFVLKHNGKELKNLPAAGTQEAKFKRVGQICGRQFCQNAYEFSSDYQGMKIYGWLTGPQASRSQNDQQYLFINGRIMKDKLVTHAIRQSYGELLADEHYPAYVVYLEIPPQDVDVNVHPTKQEVRFQQARLVHDFIATVVKETLAEHSIGTKQDVYQHHQYEPISSSSVDEPIRDYVKPLQSVADNIARPATARAPRTPASSGAVTQQAARNYQSLLKTEVNNDFQQTTIEYLSISNDSMLVKFNDAFFTISTSWLHKQHIIVQLQKTIPVSQPLLIPVAIPCTSELRTQYERHREKLLALSIEASESSQKLILRAVPAGYRDLNWVDTLSKLLQVLDSENELKAAFAEAIVFAKNEYSLQEQEFWIDQLQQRDIEEVQLLFSQLTPLPLAEWLVSHEQ